MKRDFAFVHLVLLLLLIQGCVMAEQKYEKATFAGGCFWCMEHPFDEIEGVIDVKSGYTGGMVKNPSYDEVCSGQTGHAEAVEITFDPQKVRYIDLVGHFWKQIDPTDPGGQFFDRGYQYRTAIFFHSDEQRRAAEKSREQLNLSGRFKEPIVTEISPAGVFYPAEDYHQDYYKKCPMQYKGYRAGSGRDGFIKKHWDKEERKFTRVEDMAANESKALDEKLTPLQYEVTQMCGTEPPFDNKYWDNKREGIYVDIVSGKPLFCSSHKYDSGSGWPSFFTPLDENEIVKIKDTSHGMIRTEVRAKTSGSHLGHVFEDGPRPTGLRYCINSAALKFIPREDLEEEGYGDYQDVFKD